ncbi:hypothetical protein SEA_ZENTENO07_61 [Mycobacterium phage Zenteno07]|nr:hypothetical protein SEA_ZENTENO07_61 [Mycobacterium phage Zenteno07]
MTDTKETPMTDHNHPPVCSCPGDPSASAAGWNPECRLHGTDANRHPHYRDSTDKRSKVGTGQSPIVAEAALKCADCPHPGDEPCNTRATECGAALGDPDPIRIKRGGLRFPPTEEELLASRPPNFVASNMAAIQRDLAEIERDDDNETAPGDVIHPAWLDPNHPDAPRYVHVEIGSAAPPDAPALTTGDYARQIAQDAIGLFTGDRNADYGDATDNFQDIADLWSVVLRPILAPGAAITAEQVAIMSGLIKVARLNNSPHHDDSWVDATAYFALGGGIHRRRQVADVGVDTPTAP